MNRINISHSVVSSIYWDSRQGGRPENQDAFKVVSDTPFGVFVTVCDGMGGGPSGSLASATAVDKMAEYIKNVELKETFSRKKILKDAIEYAHKSLREIVAQNPQLEGMGTTVTAILINDFSAIVAHIGDSRIYQLRKGLIHQLFFHRKAFRTQDHSFVGSLVRSGDLTEEQARLSAKSNIILKALGSRNGCVVEEDDIQELHYEKGDRFVLCTDGIWGMQAEPELLQQLLDRREPAVAVEMIMDKTDSLGRLSGNNHDNLTIALFDVEQDSKYEGKMNKKHLRLFLIIAAVAVVSLISCISLLLKDGKEKSIINNKEIINLKRYNDSLKSVNDELTKQVQLQNDNLIAYHDNSTSKESKERVKKDNKDADLNSPLVDRINAQEAAKEKQIESKKNTVEGEKSKASETSDKGTKKKDVIESTIVIPKEINSFSVVKELLKKMAEEVETYKDKKNGSAKKLQDSDKYIQLRSKIRNFLIPKAQEYVKSNYKKSQDISKAADNVKNRSYHKALELLEKIY